MRKITRILLCLILLNIFSPFFPQNVYSGDLTSTYLRLDRHKVSASTGGQICATTPASDNGTESQVQIIFPSSFTVNSTATNWTVTTTNIPTTATAWPGIATATSVSGQVVTFPSSDLSPNTQYCFNFSAANTLTNPSTAGSYEGSVRTRNNANTTIDTIDVGLSIVSNDQITVTATVPANPTDFEANLSLSDASGYKRENTTLTYTINYGSLLSNSTTITVQAEWELGTLQGNSTPTQEVLSYVVGSATKAYNNTEAVIDTLNRTISWEISSFPSNTTDKTVSFQLRTYDDYTGPLSVEFTVNGRVLGPGTQTADSSVTSTYKFSNYITPTPTPTCVPSQCPTPVPSATPTPTPVPDATRIDEIDVRTVSSTDATIFILSNNKTKAKILYGTSKNNLNLSESYLNFSNTHILKLDDIKPKTRYYFRIILTDEYGRVQGSDLYVIDTASESTPAQAKLDSLIITSSDVILTDPLRNSDSVPNLVIPSNTPFAFKFAVTNHENVKLIKAFIRNDKILGLTNNVSHASTKSLTITEISPGQYIGRLSTDHEGGNHNLVLQITDFSGNISEQTVSTINVVDALKVIDSNSKTGIENAKITLYYYNDRLRTFEILSSAITPIKNPVFTEPDGYANIILPVGKYKAEIEVLGYQTKNVEFEISSDSSNYPTVELEPQPFDAVTFAGYFAATTTDVVNLLTDFIHQLRTSYRFFDLTAFIVFCIMSCLLLISASRRTSVPIRHLPYFLGYHFLRLLKKQVHNYLVHGKVVVEGAENVIADAVVYVMQPNGRVLSRVLTNVDGEFYSKINTDTGVNILVNKKGYQTQRLKIGKNELNDVITVGLLRRKLPQKWSITSIFWYISFLTGSLFETILIITILLELLFVLEFGFAKVAPFMAISLFNLLLWAFHVRHTKSA